MLEQAPPLQVLVTDKAYARLGPVRTLDNLDLSIRRNAPGDCAFVLPRDDPMVPALATDGARCQIVYVRPDNTRRTLMSGPVADFAGAGTGPSATRTITVDDDWAKLLDMLGWVQPTQAITAQGTEGAYWTSTAPIETAMRNLIVANNTRLSHGLTIDASLGRGTSITLMSRMHTMIERTLPTLESSGLGVRVLQPEGSSAHPNVSFFEGVTRKVIYEGSGAIEDIQFHRSRPTVTRVVLGLGGEAEAREFRLFIDTARETSWGVKREVYVDARDIQLDDPNLETLAAERAAERLAEGGPKVTLSAKMVETDAFRFESGFDLGDLLPIQLDGTNLLQDRVNEIGFQFTAGEGLTISPIVGEWTEDEVTAGLYRDIELLARSVGELQRGL